MLTLLSLPEEVLLHLLSFLDVTSYLRLRQCRLRFSRLPMARFVFDGIHHNALRPRRCDPRHFGRFLSRFYPQYIGALSLERGHGDTVTAYDRARASLWRTVLALDGDYVALNTLNTGIAEHFADTPHPRHSSEQLAAYVEKSGAPAGSPLWQPIRQLALRAAAGKARTLLWWLYGRCMLAQTAAPKAASSASTTQAMAREQERMGIFIVGVDLYTFGGWRRVASWISSQGALHIPFPSVYAFHKKPAMAVIDDDTWLELESYFEDPGFWDGDFGLFNL